MPTYNLARQSKFYRLEKWVGFEDVFTEEKVTKFV
jgi:hypothetical protein